MKSPGTGEIGFQGPCLAALIPATGGFGSVSN